MLLTAMDGAVQNALLFIAINSGTALQVELGIASAIP
jgi:hypothetical protein